ncbi:hypothetical protein B0H16DRAFT_1504365 [Mycena metata]|uniref:Uncharacterized protein n=1 Tax=Mycena metata TaxID=1033252 RepID=A0AAD7K2Q8_9AGAR|nr:hypothetical protein B0H16DRAFT_1504365 [Mycena metata]
MLRMARDVTREIRISGSSAVLVLIVGCLYRILLGWSRALRHPENSANPIQPSGKVRLLCPQHSTPNATEGMEHQQTLGRLRSAT